MQTYQEYKRYRDMRRWTLLNTVSILLLGIVVLMYIIPSKESPESVPEAQKSLETSEIEKTDPLTIEGYIRTQAIANNIDPDLAVAIAKCESSLNPKAKHLISSATGLFQFTKPTWEWIKAEGDRTDYKASTEQFMKWFPVYPGWWTDCLPYEK